MILVTGPTGFIGRRVVEVLVSGGRSVRALVHTPSRPSGLPSQGVEVSHGDVLQPDSLARACEGVESVIHLVAAIRERGDNTFQKVNYEGTKNVFAAAEAAGVDRVVVASTIGATSDPAIPYLYSRWMAEQEAVRSPVAHSIIRFSLGFGEGDEFFNVLAAQAKIAPVVPIVGAGRSRFQPIAAEDVARCLVAALGDDKMAGKTTEIGGPDYFTHEQLVDAVAETLGVRIMKVHVPVGLVRPVAAIMEALAPSPPVTPQQLKMLKVDNVASLDTVEDVFGFTPKPLVGNIDYVKRIGLADALKINLGFMPSHIRDH